MLCVLDAWLLAAGIGLHCAVLSALAGGNGGRSDSTTADMYSFVFYP